MSTFFLQMCSINVMNVDTPGVLKIRTLKVPVIEGADICACRWTDPLPPCVLDDIVSFWAPEQKRDFLKFQENNG